MVLGNSAKVASTLQLDLLKSELETHDDSDFEHLSAHLISRLLGDVAITVSKSGYQVGGDAGRPPCAGVGWHRVASATKKRPDCAHGT